ncbi:hypothetical protein BDP27DRAFT_1418106 [Rhodocollybia butyracea]|uniref:Uncharacterized protein n=1 Tax=Rhodocollybia butyracea TaxID=206335 RepID=A0A9P5U9Z1_9AGAR|nr:hypothetical protein BDP27DRAFT_1418106 [Rhodocollybia butyracea]
MKEKSLSQSSNGDNSQPPYTVHQIQYGSTTNFFSQVVAENLLREGAHLLKELRNNDIWHDLKLPSNPLKVPSTSQVFTFSLQPPKAPRYTPDSILKDWHEPPTTQEIISLEDLEEFESTDFSSISRHESQFQSRKRARTPIEETEIEVEPGPRKKVPRLDTGSLHHVIPQPHIQLSKSPVSPKFSAITTYSRALPIFIPPYTSFPQCEDFDRLAWIIPVRGSLPLPWKQVGATSAVVLDPLDSSSFLEIADSIQWMHSTLQEFWKFLVALKDLKSLGALGISYRPAQSAALCQRTQKENSGLRSPSSRNSSQVRSQSEQSTALSHSARLSLTELDYFKIYHDANVSMHLRHALDLFRIDDQSEQSDTEESATVTISDLSGFPNSAVDSGKAQRCKVLRGARLVLVDDRSRGILVA